MKSNAKKDTDATESDCQWNLKRGGAMLCLVCNGSGKVITGYGVICTELVEMVEKCPDCKGKGYLD